MVEQFRRKTPEEILKSISRMHLGRLKIILGAVIGQSARTRWKEIQDGSVIQRLLREVRHMDVLVVADHSTPSK